VGFVCGGLLQDTSGAQAAKNFSLQLPAAEWTDSRGHGSSPLVKQ
jgi:hypothetical protein